VQTWLAVLTKPDTSKVDWDGLDPSELFEHIRASSVGHDAEKMIWAFERALEAARADEHLLEYLLAATVCLVAGAQRQTPRAVLEQNFRRSVSDDEWRVRYAPLLA
jgi:hypothetical protein